MHTANAISLFQDKLVTTSARDKRIKELKQFLTFMQSWKNNLALSDKGSIQSNEFISYKLWFDIKSMILGFDSLVKIKLEAYPHSVIKPAIINQDIVENHFCQVRACNGQNNNPTWRLQESAQNSIRYGQTTISRKSNAGSSR